MEFLTQNNIVKVPQDRIHSLLLTIKLFLLKKKVPARQFLSLLGKFNAAADYVTLGRLHLRPLQMSLLAQWKPHIYPLHHQIQISQNIKHHLLWWNNQQRYVIGVPIRNPHPSHQNVHRCKSDGVGSTSGTRGTIISQNLESSPSTTSNQHSRDDGNTFCVEMCPPSYCELNSSCFYRQHNRCVLHKSPGRNSLPRSVSRSLEHAELVSFTPDKHWCKTHTREIQYSSRPSFKNIEINNHRMVSETISCKCNLSDDKISKHRSFCNKVESQVTAVCVPYSGQEYIGNRCSHDELESH